MLEYLDLVVLYRLRFETVGSLCITPAYRLELMVMVTHSSKQLLWVNGRKLMLGRHQIAQCTSFRPLGLSHDSKKKCDYLLGDNGYRYVVDCWYQGVTISDQVSVLGQTNWSFAEIYPLPPLDEVLIL